MVNCISDQSGKVVSKALIAIDVFFDSMEPEEIVPYLPTVVPILIGVAASTQASVLMRTSAVCALGSGATAAGKLF